MDNPLLETTDLVLNGATYKLCFDMGALLRIEKETGINMLGALSAAKWNLTLMMAAFHAALLRFQPEVDFQALQSSLTYEQVLEAGEATLRAYGQAVAPEDGESTDGGEEKNVTTSGSTGETSGDSHDTTSSLTTTNSGD